MLSFCTHIVGGIVTSCLHRRTPLPQCHYQTAKYKKEWSMVTWSRLRTWVLQGVLNLYLVYIRNVNLITIYHSWKIHRMWSKGLRQELHQLVVKEFGKAMPAQLLNLEGSYCQNLEPIPPKPGIPFTILSLQAETFQEQLRWWQGHHIFSTTIPGSEGRSGPESLT